MILSRKLTGRGWGDKRPFNVLGTRRDAAGVKWVKWEADFWIGPVEAGETGQYERVIAEDCSLANVASSCSFRSALEKALAA